MKTKDGQPPPLRRRRSVIYNGYPGEDPLIERKVEDEDDSEEQDMSTTSPLAAGGTANHNTKTTNGFQSLKTLTVKSSNPNVPITSGRIKRPSFVAEYLRSSPEGGEDSPECNNYNESSNNNKQDQTQRINHEGGQASEL